MPILIKFLKINKTVENSSPTHEQQRVHTVQMSEATKSGSKR